MAEHEQDPKPAEASAEPEYKVFVGGISYKVDERGLKEMFERFNPINAIIQVDKQSQRPRGFGFVIFKDRESMQDAVREMHNKEVDGRTISVKEAIPMDQIKPGTRMGGGEKRGGYGGDRYGSRDRYDSRGYGDRGGYGDRYGAGYDRSYDRYDPRGSYGSYGDRGYGYGDRGGYGYGGGYDRDPYYPPRDPYASYPATGGYDRPAYDSRGGYGSYDAGRYPEYGSAYGDSDRYRAAGGPDRSRYPAPRAGPYDRPADTRRDARSAR